MLAAAGDGQKVTVHRHARRGVSLAEADAEGNTALHRAAASGSVGLVKVGLYKLNAVAP
jgi:ankyrin repeat protein